MRTRPYNYFDTSTKTVWYGIQVHINGKWLRVSEDGKPLLFKTAIARDTKQDEIRRIKL